ncbi:histidine phosphatase family protein [Furfurilactobacillus sp. WILCCON 0119]
MVTVHLVRHAQTVANVTGVLQGTVNDERTALTALGQQACKQMRPLLAQKRLACCYISPLTRAQNTAAIILPAAVPRIVDDRLQELDYGDWNGQPLTTLKTTFPTCWNLHDHDVAQGYEQLAHGESLHHLDHRLNAFLTELQTTPFDGDVMVVTHGLVIQRWLTLLHQPSRPIDNLELITVTI